MNLSLLQFIFVAIISEEFLFVLCETLLWLMVNAVWLFPHCWQDDGAEGRSVTYATLQTPPAKPPRSATKDTVPETEYGTVISA